MDGLFFFLSIIVIAKSPLGKAIADRIAGRTRSDSGSLNDLDAVEQRIEDRVLDLEERIEFAERLLQQRRSREELPPVD